MLTKIESNNYLQRFTSMTLVEKHEYLAEVQEWLKQAAPLLLSRTADAGAIFMTAMQCSVGWSDAECRAWMHGLKLMSAFAASDPMFKAAYTDSAKETIKWMTRGLKSILNAECTMHNEGPAPAQPTGGGRQPIPSAEILPLTSVKKRGRPRKDAGAAKDALTMVPTRPKHIDQYVHLLPQKTQERAAEVKSLLRDMDAARENARRLMEAKEHPDKIAQWATMVTKIDNKLKSIYKELDAEWEKLVQSGRVTVDTFGNAHVVESPSERQPVPSEKSPVESPTPPLPECQPIPSAETLPPTEGPGEGLSARRRTLRKWLGDTRRGNGATREEHVTKWREKFAEYLAIEGEAAFSDEKIKAAAKHYGIELRKLEEKGEEEKK